MPLIPQPHGGALLAAGRKGGTPGTGRPKSAIREKLRKVLEDDGVEYLRKVLAGEIEGASISDRIRAADVVAKHGLGSEREVTLEWVGARVAQTVAIVRAELGDEDAQRVLQRLREVWR